MLSIRQMRKVAVRSLPGAVEHFRTINHHPEECGREGLDDGVGIDPWSVRRCPDTTQLLYEFRGPARPARAPHLFAGLHCAPALRCAAWRFRIKSHAACAPILSDFTMCSTVRRRRGSRAWASSPITCVRHSICATGAGGCNAQAAPRRWACSSAPGTLRCPLCDATAPGGRRPRVLAHRGGAGPRCARRGRGAARACADTGRYRRATLGLEHPHGA